MQNQKSITLENLLAEVKSFKQKEKNVDLNNYKQSLLNQLKNKAEIQEAVDLLLAGIKIYQESENAVLALEKINQSIINYPTADAYFNKGVIEQCIGNHYGCFLSTSASLIFDNTNIPKAYFYRAFALYSLYSEIPKNSTTQEIALLDCIIEDLFKASELGETHAVEMLKQITMQRMELYEKF